MLNRYKIRLIKKYDFELDETPGSSIRQQVEYIDNQTKILDLPDVKKSVKIRIRKIIGRRATNEEDN